MLVTQPTAAEIQSVWGSMGGDRAAYNPTTCEAWQEAVASGAMLLTLAYQENTMVFAAWQHDLHIVDDDCLGWLGGWAHPQWRGAAIRASWQQCRESFVAQGVTIFCAGTSAQNRRSIVAIRRILGFPYDAGCIPQWAQYEGKVTDARIFVEQDAHRSVAYAVACERARAEKRESRHDFAM